MEGNGKKSLEERLAECAGKKPSARGEMGEERVAMVVHKMSLHGMDMLAYPMEGEGVDLTHVEVLLEEAGLNPKYAAKVSFPEYLYLINESTLNRIEELGNMAAGICLDMWFFLFSLRNSRRKLAAVENLFGLNYGAFKMCSYRRLNRKMLTEKEQERYYSFASEPDDRTFGEVIDEAYRSIRKSWSPDTSLQDYGKRIRESYERLYREVYYPLFLCFSLELFWDGYKEKYV